MGRERGRQGRHGRQEGFKEEEGGFRDTVVKIVRCAKVVKGGKRFSFGALVVVGNHQGDVGMGYGKANEVPVAVEKAIKDAKKNLLNIPLVHGTIPHRVEGRYGATRVVMIPAGDGTGIKAGSAARAILQMVGIQNVLTKVLGNTNPRNVLKATLEGLGRVRTRQQIEELRGVRLS